MPSRFHRVLGALGVALALLPAIAAAQGGTTISGRVTSDAGTPLSSASVFVQGMNLGTLTKPDGSYSFTVPAGRATGQTVTLTARLIGYTPQSAQIALTGAEVTHDFVLPTSAVQLQGVVTTALGIAREKSQLGTAQQQLSSTELNQTRTQNILNQIQGKVSGVQITGSGTQGGSTNIIIRGANSITGNNQPLFIVDGVVVSNRETRSRQTTGAGTAVGGSANGGYDYGSAIQDINPDDIETMSVLKGPNAAALYGSRAANGVIVITTKRAAAGRVRTEINTSYTFERPSILPTYQNLYGQGAEGEFQFVDGQGSGTNDGADQSWGPRLNGQPIDQFTGKAQPWVAHPDNIKDFFHTGHTLASTIAVSGGTDRATARLSLGTENTDGYVPNSFFKKTTGLLSGSVKVNDRISTEASLQYIRNNARNRPGTGYNVGIMEQFIWFGRQIDMDALKRAYRQSGAVNGGPDNRELNWNYNYHNNPYWLQYENPLADTRDRFIGTVSATYRPLDWLSGTLSTGSDIYRFNIDQRYGPGNLNFSDQSYYGAFSYLNEYSNENSSTLLLRADRQLLSGIRFNGTLGGSQRREQYRNDQTATTGISVAGIYNVSNAAINPTLSQFTSRRRVNSVFGSAAFTLNEWWTVEGTARNDWSSTLPKGNNSYFYPSVNTSVVLTDAMPSIRGDILSYAKLRASFARVGSDAPPYQLRATYIGNPNKFAGLPQFRLDDAIANPDLKPEITRSGEFGVELGFLNGRATLDASVYNKSTRDQIFNIAISPTSGFSSKWINAGRIDNKGAEALLTVIPLQLRNGLQWTSTFNYTRNKSEVVELSPGITTIVLGRTWSTNIEARQGEAYGAIFGRAFARDDAGRLLLSGGLPQYGELEVLGNIQPDWVGGWSNQITFRNLSLNVLLDIRQGGDIFSVSNYFGDYAGVFKSSLRGREVDWDNPGIVVQGIDEETGEPNTTTVTAEQYFQNLFGIVEPYIYDASYVKLREIRLGFDLPARWANRMYARAVNVAITGRNLHTWTDVPNIDPEFSYTTGNFQGAEFAALPNARAIGFSLRVTP